MSLDELLCLPGLDGHIVAWLGPIHFHRFRNARADLCSIQAPTDIWRARWLPPEESLAAEAAAMELLNAVDMPCGGGANGVTDILEELYMLTSVGRPSAYAKMPVHNLLDVAVQRVLRPAIPLLLHQGYTLEMLDAYSLESHVQQDNCEAVAAYLDAGISPDIRANAGRPILMVASAVSALKVSELLLERKADVNERSGFGQWTALMWAAHAGWEDGCKMLLEAGAGMEHQNDQGFSALSIARQRRHSKVEVLLEEYGNA